MSYGGRDYKLERNHVLDADNRLVATITKPGSFTTLDGGCGNYNSSTGKVYIKGVCIGRLKIKKNN